MFDRLCSRARMREVLVFAAVSASPAAQLEAGIPSFRLLAGASLLQSSGSQGGCPGQGHCSCGAITCACEYYCGCPSDSTQPPYKGPIWRAGDGGKPLVVFPSLNVTLLSWIPVTQFDASFNSSSTVEGYVSASGREYAIIGLSGGTGYVEVTHPTTATIVKVVPDCVSCSSSLWRDVKVYDHYAYVVSEASNTGIQVCDLSDIDNGNVTVVNTVTTPGSTATHTVEINKSSGYLYRCGGGSTLGIRIYSLANPALPAFVSTANAGRYTHECQAVNYTSGPYAGKEIVFAFTENNSGGGSAGLTILDVTNKAAIVTLTSNYQYPGASFSHQGWLSPDRHYLYLDDELDNNPNTRVLDVSNLSAPVQVATFNSGSPAIDHNLYTLGNLIFESNYRSGIRIFSATNPTAPVQVAYFDTYVADDNAQFNSLWDNYPYLPSGIVLGSDIEQGLFVWCAGKTGDMNRDFKVDSTDIQPFVDALVNGSPSNSLCSGPDVNQDGKVDGQDIGAFAAAYLAGP